MAQHSSEHILRLDCVESPGIVQAVSGFLVEHGCDIIDNQQFGDRGEGHFFMRIRLVADSHPETTERLRRDFSTVASRFAMSWSTRPNRKSSVVSGSCP